VNSFHYSTLPIFSNTADRTSKAERWDTQESTMAKEKPEAKLSKEERRALKAEKKAEKKSKAAPVDGGLVADAGVTKVKSDKKEKKAKREALKEKVLNEIEKSEVAEVKDRDARKKDLADDDVDRDMEVRSDDGRVDEEENTKKEAVRPIGALVPFANPLADEKVAKKVFKCVKKGMFLVLTPFFPQCLPVCLFPVVNVCRKQGTMSSARWWS